MSYDDYNSDDNHGPLCNLSFGEMQAIFSWSSAVTAIEGYLTTVYINSSQYQVAMPVAKHKDKASEGIINLCSNNSVAITSLQLQLQTN